MIAMTNLRDGGERENNDHNDRKSTATHGYNESISHNRSTTAPSFVKRNLDITDNHKILTKNIIFDSIGTQFHASVFFFQLVGHIFPPFLFAFTRNRYGQGLKWSFPSNMNDIISPIAFYVMIVCFLLCSDEDRMALGHTIYFPAMFFLVHRNTVALKYATMSKTEYKRFMTCTDHEMIDNYITQLQLLGGWFSMDNIVSMFELGAASARIGAKINEIYFRFGSNLDDPIVLSQYRHWNAFLRGHERIDTELDNKPAREIKKLPNGDYGVSVFDVCATIIRQAAIDNSSANNVLSYAVSISIFIMISVLFFPVVQYGNDIQSFGLASGYLFAASLLTWNYANAYFNFVFVSILDVGRFLKMAQTLHRMIRLSDLMVDNAVSLDKGESSECEDLNAKIRVDALLALCNNNHNPQLLAPQKNNGKVENSISTTSTSATFYNLERREELDRMGEGRIADRSESDSNGK